MLLCWVAAFTLLPAYLAVVGAPLAGGEAWQSRPSVEGRARPLTPGSPWPFVSLVGWRRSVRPELAAGSGSASSSVRLPQADGDQPRQPLQSDRHSREPRPRPRQRSRPGVARKIDRRHAGSSSLARERRTLLRRGSPADEGSRRRRGDRRAATRSRASCRATRPRSSRAHRRHRSAAQRWPSEHLARQLEAEAPARRVRNDLRAQRTCSASPDASEDLLDRFRERDGSIGNLAVVTAKPDAQLERSPRLVAFARAVRNVSDASFGGQRYDAAGESVILADLLDDIDREGPRTTALSFAGVCLLVIAFFSQWRRRLEVLVSLVAGVAIMAGAATLIGIRINFFNFIVFPITFGIARSTTAPTYRPASAAARGPGSGRAGRGRPGGFSVLAHVDDRVLEPLLLHQSRAAIVRLVRRGRRSSPASSPRWCCLPALAAGFEHLRTQSRARRSSGTRGSVALRR